MITKEQIISTLKLHKPYFEKEFGIKRIGLFGSYAKDLQQTDSDVDIFIELKSNDYRTILKTLLYLEKSLQTKVDLIYNGPHLRPSFLKTVEKEIVYA